MTSPRRRSLFATVLWVLAAASVASAPAVGADDVPRRAAGAMRGGGESQIDESSPDESPAASKSATDPVTLPDRLREYVEGSLARYDSLKSGSAGFRRRGWFPSLYLRDPGRDVVVETGAAGGVTVTVHLSSARRDLEQRLVIAPADQFELPGADKRFLAELLGALATAAPEVHHVRLSFWFADLRADGQMTWVSQGDIGIGAAAARRFPAGSRTAEAIWPLLDENTIPPSVWDGP